MATDTPTTTTSTEASEHSTTVELAKKIRSRGWWQGSIVLGAELRKYDSTPDVEEHREVTHWLVASQACNLFNADFDKIPRVEWVGAKQIQTSNIDSRIKFGKNPRLLQCYVLDQGDSDSWYECDIQARHWSPRTCLAAIAPIAALEDKAGDDWTAKQKDIFARWIARSYTRLELSDELGESLKSGKFSAVMEAGIKNQEKNVFGIFLDIAELEDGDEEPQTPSPQKPVEERMAPCTIEVTFVTQKEDQIEALKKSVNGAFDMKVPDSEDQTGKVKISRLDILKRLGVRITLAYRDAKHWNVSDIERTTRYTFGDHVSGSNEAGEN